MSEKLRKELMDKWNHRILCNMPSKKTIRKIRRKMQHVRREMNSFFDTYIDEAMKQKAELLQKDANLQEYISSK
jgi:hypothetical protein